MPWKPSFNLVAQTAHIGWGAYIPCLFRHHHHMLFGIVGMLIYAFVKEFIFDLLVERDSIGDSAEDFSYYIVGVALAVAL